MVPRYVFAGYPLTIELPTYITFPGSNYYNTRRPFPQWVSLVPV